MRVLIPGTMDIQMSRKVSFRQQRYIISGGSALEIFQAKLVLCVTVMADRSAGHRGTSFPAWRRLPLCLGTPRKGTQQFTMHMKPLRSWRDILGHEPPLQFTNASANCVKGRGSNYPLQLMPIHTKGRLMAEMAQILHPSLRGSIGPL